MAGDTPVLPLGSSFIALPEGAAALALPAVASEAAGGSATARVVTRAERRPRDRGSRIVRSRMGFSPEKSHESVPRGREASVQSLPPPPSPHASVRAHFLQFERRGSRERWRARTRARARGHG